MANLRDIRRRIRSVKNTQQITKAMKMVAAAKLRRAQERIFAARPYAKKMLEVLNSLATRADQTRHPLLGIREEKLVQVAVLTGDRGLCGAFNTNILKRATKFINERKAGEVSLSVIPLGKKARDHFRRRHADMPREWIDLFRAVQYSHAEEIAGYFIEQFTRKEVDAVYLIYNEFKSVIQQRVVVERLLPIERLEFDGNEGTPDYEYEPSDQVIYETLLPKHVTFQVYRALLESAAAEHGARMTAMESATINAKEMIENLTLHANRVRQAGITRELIEIVSGAEALK